MILAFAHPGLVVPDLEKAREFYERMFGFTVINNEGWENEPEVDQAIGLKNSASRGYLMAGHNCHLELWEYSAPDKSGPQPSTLGAQELGIRHLAFYVDNCHEECRRLEQLGGRILGKPAGGEDSGYVAYCRDPFGNIIELCEIPSPDEDPTRLPGVATLGDFSA